MKKVLIVEDNQDICTILKERLKKEGFSIEVAKGGYDLLGCLKNQEMPTAVILDIMLPERSGIELLSSIKSKWQETKIFIFTAHPECKEKLHLFKEYISGFFCKTDGMDNLIKAIEKEIG